MSWVGDNLHFQPFTRPDQTPAMWLLGRNSQTNRFAYASISVLNNQRPQGIKLDSYLQEIEPNPDSWEAAKAELEDRLNI
jgi:hypothetical protein